MANHKCWNYELTTFTTPLTTCHVLGSMGAAIWLPHPCRTLEDAMYGVWRSYMRVSMSLWIFLIFNLFIQQFLPSSLLFAGSQLTNIPCHSLISTLLQHRGREKKNLNKEKDDENKGPFGSCKSIYRKYFIFWKCYFPERKMYSGVWLPRNSFYGKSIPVFGSYKHFTENDFCFTENQFPCLVRSNILLKMEFVFYGKSILMFGLWIILRKITISITYIT